MAGLIIDFCTLSDFALGKLSSDDSLCVIAELERNPQASRDLEFILKLIAHFEAEENHNHPEQGDAKAPSVSP